MQERLLPTLTYEFNFVQPLSFKVCRRSKNPPTMSVGASMIQQGEEAECKSPLHYLTLLHPYPPIFLVNQTQINSALIPIDLVKERISSS
jgi:hypothetical protein